MQMIRYDDRFHAGRVLGNALHAYRGRDDLLILALPRGGVPVAYAVAGALAAPLDVMVVRKLGCPGREELAMGAVATGDVLVMNEDVVAATRVPQSAIDEVVARELRELRRRERVFRGDRAPPQMEARCVILVDDGLATGATMRAAVRAMRKHQPAQVVVAVPVASRHTVQVLRQEVDEVVCPSTPEWFMAIGQFYGDFTQTSDEEVRALLEHAWEARSSPERSTPPASI